MMTHVQKHVLPISKATVKGKVQLVLLPINLQRKREGMRGASFIILKASCEKHFVRLPPKISSLLEFPVCP